MKVLSIICLLSLILGGTPIHFNPPTVFPQSLDELYQLVETGQGNWVFTACTETPTNPSLKWSQVKQIQDAMEDDHDQALILMSAKKMNNIVSTSGIQFPETGNLNISENMVFAYLFLGAFSSDLRTCSLPGEKVVLYGQGVQWIFDKVAQSVK